MKIMTTVFMILAMILSMSQKAGSQETINVITKLTITTAFQGATIRHTVENVGVYNNSDHYNFSMTMFIIENGNKRVLDLDEVLPAPPASIELKYETYIRTKPGNMFSMDVEVVNSVGAQVAMTRIDNETLFIEQQWIRQRNDTPLFPIYPVPKPEFTVVPWSTIPPPDITVEIDTTDLEQAIQEQSDTQAVLLIMAIGALVGLTFMTMWRPTND